MFSKVNLKIENQMYIHIDAQAITKQKLLITIIQKVKL